MSHESVPFARITVKRLLLQTLVLGPIVFLVLSYWFSIEHRIPEWYYWQAELVFLLTAEIAYIVIVALAVLGTVVTGLLFLRGTRQTPMRRSVLAKLLLLCVALVLAAIPAELACTLWQNRQHTQTAMPIGGLGRDLGRVDVTRFRTPITDIPLRTDFPDSPGDREIDMVILGESSAEGVPYSNWISLGSILSWKLTEAVPNRPVRARVLANSGETLERQHHKLASLLQRPDLLVIYCGHNEFSARLADSRDLPYYLDDSQPSFWYLMIDQIERASSLCALIGETAEKCRIAIPPTANGLRKLVDVPLYSPAEYNTLLIDFRRRLEAIVAYAEKVGSLPVLIIPAANDAGFEPSRSFLPAETTRAERQSFQRDFAAARQLESENTHAAIERYRSLLARYPGFAESHYRLARLLEKASAWDEAYQHDIAARDCDGYPARAMSAFQNVYRDVASQHDCVLIDTQSYFHAIGKHGLLDDSFFQDAMHPSLRGQIALAQAALQALQARQAFGLPKEAPVSVIDPAECVAHFGLDAAWRAICLWGINFNTLAAPLTYDPARRLKARVASASAAERITGGEPPESLGLPNIGTPKPVPTVPMDVIHGPLTHAGGH